LKNKNILVTGGAGFLGSHLVERLVKDKNKVIVLDNLSSGSIENLNIKDIEFLEGDVSSQKDLKLLEKEEIDTVFHLAAQANVPLSVDFPENDFKSNVIGTFNILKLVREMQISKIIFPSTPSVLDQKNKMPLSEEARMKPISPYGAAKLAGEAYCHAFYECYKVNVNIIRFFNIYGPRMNKYVIYDFIRKLQQDPLKLEILGDGSQIRDYVYVTDAVEAMILTAKRGIPGEIYNVGSGKPVVIKDLAKMIINFMGLNNVKIMCTGTSWPGDIPRWYADIKKIQKLEFRPRFPLEEGLKRTVEWLGSH